jgi:radical SAM protein with 4Fe4S-binding SPASM domain
MKCLPPDHSEQRGDRTLLVWAEPPFWTIVDRPAARFIQALGEGKSPAQALDFAAGKRGGLERDAATVIAELRRAGVVKPRRLRFAKERIESITVNVTNRCNLRCRFCYNEPRDGDSEISAAEMIRALEGVRRWTAKGATLALLGGEPLLEKEKTLALARWGRGRGMQVIVSTNGLLVDDAFAREAARIGLDCQVSIDGANAASHEANRGAGTWEPALAAVRSLVANGAHTIMSMVFHTGSVADIPDYLRLAERLGAHEARFIPIKRVAGGGEYRVPDLAGVIRTVAATVRAEPNLGRLLGRDYVSILGQTCRTCSLRPTCGTGSQTLLLDADGAVYPCINLVSPEFRAGNIKTEPLGHIWCRSEVLRDVRERVRVTARTETCARCLVRHWCMGGCRGETFATTGRLDAPSATCGLNRKAILEMFWTLAEWPGLGEAKGKVC